MYSESSKSNFDCQILVHDDVFLSNDGEFINKNVKKTSLSKLKRHISTLIESKRLDCQNFDELYLIEDMEVYDPNEAVIINEDDSLIDKEEQMSENKKNPTKKNSQDPTDIKLNKSNISIKNKDNSETELNKNRPQTGNYFSNISHSSSNSESHEAAER